MKWFYLLWIIICSFFICSCSKEWLPDWLKKQELVISPYMEEDMLKDIFGETEYKVYTSDVKGFVIKIINKSEKEYSLGTSI